MLNPPYKTGRAPAGASTILIVEDEEDMVELLDYRLRKERFHPVIARDGKQACQLAEAIRPDCILLDIMLPEKDGWEVCRHIRNHADERLATTPIIMLSALCGRDTRLKGLELGADIYISKPYSVQEVLLSCRRLVEARRRQRALDSEIHRLRNQEQCSSDLQSMLCHELRCQLALIAGFSRRLRKNIHGSDNDQNLRYLKMIEQGTFNLTSLSEEILLMRQVETGELRLPLDEFDLQETVVEVLGLYQQMAKAKKICISMEPLPSIRVKLHRGALKVILSSLLENAIKYCARESTVRLTAHLAREDRLLRVEVADDGPGITPEEQEMVFGRYYRGRTARKTSRGTGLGLYAVRRLAEAMAGQVRLISAPGKGSRFQVTFALAGSGAETIADAAY